MLIALDIETQCAKPGCKKFGFGRQCTDGHALHQHFNNITCLAVFYEVNSTQCSHVFRKAEDFISWRLSIKEPIEFIFHNGKFDIKSLKTNWGVDLSEQYFGDSEIAAVASPIKIPEKWLEEYEEKKKLKNKITKSGTHRTAGGYSLKALAPYFLEVEPFWETDDHNNDEYVIKDAKYTYYLYLHLISLLKETKCFEFYEKLFRWNKTLLDIEKKGVRINTSLLETKFKSTIDELYLVKNQLDTLWKEPYQTYYLLQTMEISNFYDEKLIDQINKIKKENKGDISAKIEAKKIQSKDSREKAAQKLVFGLNLDSPKQLTWLLRDYFKLDIRNDQGKESTGNEVIERLIQEGNKDLELYQRYRELEKLVTSFFSSYKDNLVEDKLHTSFRLAGTRTGRLSSSTPLNLQQVPGHLHELFIPEDGHLFFTADYSSLEPILIAYFSEDKNLCNIALENRNFHDYVTKHLLDLKCDEKDVKKLYKKERDLIKQVDLSLLYGAGPKRLKVTCLQHGFDWSEEFCRQLYQKFKAMFPRYFEWKKEVENEFIKNGYVRNIMNRPLYIEKQEDLYLKAVNTLIQSSGSDLLMESIEKINKKFEVKLTVHDEVVVQLPKDDSLQTNIDYIRSLMINYPLHTQYGQIHLNIEYKVSDFWEK